MPSNYRRSSPVGRVTVWIVVGGLLALVAAAIWVRGLLGGLEPLDRGLVYSTAVFSIALSGAAGVLICLVWYLAAEHPDSLDESVSPVD